MDQEAVAVLTQLPVTGDTHPTPAANPTPSHGPNTLSHPSYGEMITAAIIADNSQGKEGGSSKRAIAKYIEQVYTNLPPTHSALLTHHLQRLKNSGYLVMVKNSYQLSSSVPRSGGSPPPTNPSPSPTPKRGPGRPPKFKPAQPTIEPNNAPSSAVKRPRGRPPKQPAPETEMFSEAEQVPFVQPISEVHPNPSYGPDPGLINDQPVQKRRPGRPPKQPVPEAHQPAPGLVEVPVNGTAAVLPRRRPGRPPKTNGVGSEGRPRGRPRKNALGPVSRPVGKRPRGRPPKLGGGVSVAVVQGKRRGRPPKGTGRPVGRPRKHASIAVKQTSEQGMATEELIRKLEYIQLTIRDAVGVLRPCIANDNEPNALTALQQLEELATMNLTSPPPPSPPPPPPPPATMTTMPLGGEPASVAAELPSQDEPPMVSVSAPLHAPSGMESQHQASWFLFGDE